MPKRKNPSETSFPANGNELVESSTANEVENQKKQKLGPDETSKISSIAEVQKAEMTCPGCHEDFDFKIHLPFIGSCGHSLCDICVNDNFLVACPACKDPEGFRQNHRNKLAIELLKIVADREKGQTRDFLTSMDRYSLAKVINQMDPRSFSRFSRTSKAMHKFCFENKDIAVVYDNLTLSVTKDNRFWLTKIWATSLGNKQCGFLNRKTLRNKKLAKYPFVFELHEVTFKLMFTDEVAEKVRSYFAEFPIKKINYITAGQIGEWNGFVQIVQDFRPKELLLNSKLHEQIPEEAATKILRSVDSIYSFEFSLPVACILQANTPVIDLASSSGISRETMDALILKSARCFNFISWKFKFLNKEDFGHHDLFKTISIHDQGPLPTERPLVFVCEGKNEFWILRTDEKLVCCSNVGADIMFAMVGPRFYPSYIKSRVRVVV